MPDTDAADTALIAAMGMWRISSLQMASERAATQEIEQQTLVEDWASDIRLNWVRTEAFLKAIDRDYMEKLTADTQATATSMESKVKRIEGLVQDDQARALLTAIAAARAAYSDKLNEIRELHRDGEPNVPAMVDTDLRTGRSAQNHGHAAGRQPARHQHPGPRQPDAAGGGHPGRGSAGRLARLDGDALDRASRATGQTSC